jgi:serine/threonine-protein kinase
MPAEIPPADWPRVKALFFAAHEAPEADRARLLADADVAPDVRAHVARLLAAAAGAAGRFEAPALGGAPAVDDAELGAPLAAGRRLGPWAIVRRVGEGGMGTVYEARRADGDFVQRVALKTVWRGADSQLLLRRFRSERQILAGLQHPNIARLLDGGATDDGLPYLVMEYVDGAPIDAWCDARRLPIPARLDLFRQVCAAVAHAHRNLVVHRDLKPGNVLVTADGAVKLLDFGVAKLLDDAGRAGTLTGAGLSPFTAGFAAPEQVTGGRVSTATDVHALGALLHVLLAGRPPFAGAGAGPADVVSAIRDRPAPPPSEVAGAAPDDAAARARALPSRARLARALRGELDAIVLVALRKEPERRYPTVDALADDVRRHLRGDRVLARPDTLAYRTRAFVRRQRGLAAGLLVAAAALVVGAGAALWQARASRLEARRAERVAAFLGRTFATSDATTGDPVARLGTRGTVAALLDSLAGRVAGAFPDDARVRARLYTTIGAHYAAQGRGREAAAALDSAVRLARESDGARGDAFAAASLERADAVLGSRGPAVAARDVDAASAALAGRERAAPELAARALVLRARVLAAAGAVREADALARRVERLELARTRAPTITRAWALRVLGYSEAWLRRDPRLVAARHAHAVAITDSLGTPLARERLDALEGLAEALLVLGRTRAADSVAALGLAAARAGYGEASLEHAVLLSRAASVAGELPGGGARASALADSAWRLAARLPDAPAEPLTQVAMTLVDDHLAHGRAGAARAVADAVRARVAPQRVPVATVHAEFYAGRARLAGGDAAGAERALRAALAALPPTRDLDSMRPRLRRPLAEALAAQGRTREADSVRALDPPPARAPRCTPGGDWRGC